jgi:CRP-like cAMP-binding protein
MIHQLLPSEMTSEESKLNQFFSSFPLVSFQPGSIITRAGQVSPFMYFITEGCVKMSTTGPSGKTLTLHLFQPYACFSLLQLINRDQNTYDYQTIAPTKARQIPAATFLELIQNNPEIATLFTVRMTKAVAGLLKRIEQSSFVPANQQLASLLLYFVRHYGEPTSGGILINLRLKHHALAEWLGLTRENVSLQLKQLEKKDYIQKRNNLIIIPDLSRLEKLASGIILG